MTNKLDLQSRIDKTKLRSDEYFSSLCEQAQSLKLLSDFDLEKIRTELFGLLSDICKTVAEKGSSSMQFDTAQEISESIVYTLSHRLKSCETPEEAVKLLQTQKLSVLFTEGREELVNLLCKTKAKWTFLQKKLFKTGNSFFGYTVNDGMKAFFANYNYKMYAQKSVILFDYPVYNYSEKLTGLEFVSKKFDGFIAENSFLLNFESDAVHGLLCNLDGQIGKESEERHFYLDAPVNLYFHVLACALALVLCGKDPFSLKLSETDFDFIQNSLCKKNYDEVLKTLDEAFEKLLSLLELSADEKDYVSQSIRKMSSEISLSYGLNIGSIFLCKKAESETEKYVIESMPKMSDVDFRFLLGQIHERETAESIAQLISESIQNEDDFEEFVKSALLTKEEIFLCIKKLKNPALILLLKKYLSKDGNEEKDKLIMLGIAQYFKSLSADEKAVIEKILNSIG